MTNYGLPLRFKAVDTETGRVIPTIEWDGLHTVMDLQIVGLVDKVANHCKIKLYQSTGHTDANGVEVFFGDVVLCKCTCSKEEVLWKVIYSHHEAALQCLITGEIKAHMLRKITHVIGNIHTPQAEIERRAKEVAA